MPSHLLCHFLHVFSPSQSVLHQIHSCVIILSEALFHDNVALYLEQMRGPLGCANVAILRFETQKELKVTEVAARDIVN